MRVIIILFLTIIVSVIGVSIIKK